MTTFRRSPWAIALLERLSDVPPDVLGDLEEAHGRRRSQSWLWRQVIGLIALCAYRQVLGAPLRVVGALATGWTVLVAAFLLGDRVADGLAAAIWGWDVTAAYGTGWWWPFQLCATAVSYGVFVTSAWIVGRSQAGNRPLVVLYVASVWIGLAAAAGVVAVLSAQQGYVRVPHPLFYFLHVTLPYQGRSGLALVPLDAERRNAHLEQAAAVF